MQNYVGSTTVTIYCRPQRSSKEYIVGRRPCIFWTRIHHGRPTFNFILKDNQVPASFYVSIGNNKKHIGKQGLGMDGQLFPIYLHNNLVVLPFIVPKRTYSLNPNN